KMYILTSRHRMPRSPLFPYTTLFRSSIDQVIDVCERLVELGVDDLSLGDTLGTAVPSQVERLLEAILYRFPTKNIIMHFHNTKGMAIANIVTSLRYGIIRFDASLGGLGGCP